MNDRIEYTHADIARHDLSRDKDFTLPTYVGGVLDDGNLPDGFTVADAIIGCCTVGYGGHFDELLDTEEDIFHSLALHLFPLYHGLTHDEVLAALCKLRDRYHAWVLSYMQVAYSAWMKAGYLAPEVTP